MACRLAGSPTRRSALVGERDDAGRQAVAFLIGDDLHLAAFHDGHDRVRRTQVDADDFLFGHCGCSLLPFAPGQGLFSCNPAAAQGANWPDISSISHQLREYKQVGCHAKPGDYHHDLPRLTA